MGLNTTIESQLRASLPAVGPSGNRTHGSTFSHLHMQHSKPWVVSGIRPRRAIRIPAHKSLSDNFPTAPAWTSNRFTTRPSAMGRPRVPLSQRRRAAEACTYCRTAKKKCSSVAPCTQCLRRGVAESCTFTREPRGSRSDARVSDAGASFASVESVARGTRSLRQGSRVAGHGGEEPSQYGLQSRPGMAADGVKKPGQPGTAVSSNSPRGPQARMLVNLHGERVFIGGAASISFLQAVRDIVTEHVGPSQFSSYENSDRMLETEAPVTSPSTRGPIDMALSLEDALFYASRFQSAVEGFLHIFLPSEVEDLLSEAYGSPLTAASNADRQATADLIVAIGAQCESPASTRHIGLPLFQRAQQIAFTGMLENPSIDMIRIFLLLAFYLLGACRRNAAFVYLGVAIRAAVVLGLHSQQSYANLSGLVYQLRLRVWLSVCIVDMFVSSVLGRPAAVAALRSDLEGSFTEMISMLQGTDVSAIMASYKILCIISDVVDKLYGSKEVSATLIETYLDRIESWSHEHADLFQEGSGVLSSDGLPDGGTIGNIHISCLYYFAATLITRPILVSTLIVQPGTNSPAKSHMASTCLDAAVYLVQTCRDAQKRGFLLGNMCMLKALVFAAGLILGFQVCTRRAMDYSTEKVFGDAMELLRFWSGQSAQAAHYLEILTLLSKAIDSQRERLVPGRRKYVSKLMSLEGTGPEGSTQRSSSGHSYEATSASVPNTRRQISIGALTFETGLDGELFGGWDSLDLSQWDNFPFFNTANT